MDVSLLETKFYFPTAKQPLVSRPRLTSQLEQGLQGPLVLISGAPGSGKTTILSEWYGKAGRGLPAAWLSLDENDNDIQTFLSYLYTALDKVHSGLKDDIFTVLESAQPSEFMDVLKSLINSLSSIEHDFLLVLDDYHVITSSDIHAAMSFLIENSPRQMHMVFLTRIDPPLPLARLRAHGKLVEIRDRDLQFTLDEAAFFLKHIMRLPLSDEQVKALEVRTEGWVAGLQMAALSMRDKEDLAGFITAFTGSHRFIIDYLVEEVLSRQAPDLRAFLLKTSILDRFSADLCDMLTSRTDSQRVLEQLEAANLFIIPLDDHRKWYRYHHLFADLLRNMLKQSLPGQVRELHRLASQWYEDHGYLDEALSHAASTQDAELVEKILGTHALEMIDHGYTRSVNRWLAGLPQTVIERNPTLGLCMAICAHHIPPRDFARSEAWLQKAEMELASQPAGSEAVKNLTINIAANRINLARMTDASPEDVLALIAGMLARYPDLPAKQLAFIYFNKADAHLQLLDLEAAERTFARIQALGPLPEDPYDRLAGISKQIDLYARRAEFDKARQLCLATLPVQGPEVSEPNMADPVYGLIDVCYGEILLNQGELEQAKQFLELGYKRLLATAEIAAQARALMNLLRLAFYQDDQAEADHLIDKIKGLHSQSVQTAEILSWLHKTEKDPAALAQIERLLADNPFLPDAQIDLPGVLLREERRFYTQLIQAYATVTLFENKRVADIEPVLGFIQMQSHYAQVHGWKIRLTQLYIIHALAWHALDEQDQAHAMLVKALHLADTYNGVGVFLEFRQSLQSLLAHAASSYPIRDDFFQKIMALVIRPIQPRPENPVSPDELSEPLTEREQDVLRLMAAGLSNPEIAQELYLGLNTIKTHTRGIYGKLGVSNRTQATVRARELGLV